MSKQAMVLRFLALFSILAVLAVVGCTSEEEATGGTETGTATEAQPVDEGTAEAVTVESQLAAADALDGEVDKVVTRCASCKLSMDGSPEYSLEVAGYKMLFCAEGCKKRFEEDPEASVLAMVIPE
jgi:YHS domain-containing protein